MSESPESSSASHRLELRWVELVGGGRHVDFRPGLNIILGDITTGKTTLVRLVRAMLGTMPKNLIPEVDHVQAIRGSLLLGARGWRVYRRRTTTSDALVEVSEDHPEPHSEPVSLRLPVSGAERSYSRFLLEQLALPAVSVPRARAEPSSTLSPVTITDWLGYCIVPGDELDTEVFGHRRDWRDAKRRWVFELAYGYYDPEVAELNAKVRSVELQLAVLDQSVLVQERFLADTPFADQRALEGELAAREDDLRQIHAQRQRIGADVDALPGVRALRQNLLDARAHSADVADRANRLAAQITDLIDLQRQLNAQSAQLTRAVVADEWLVDYDFIVCPRCGNDVLRERTDPDRCYLCLQEPRPAQSRLQLLAEQDRIASQIAETADVIKSRESAENELRRELAELEERIEVLSAELDMRTSAFVSDRATELERHAAEQASVEGEIRRLREYLDLLHRHQRHLRDRESLVTERENLLAEIHGKELSKVDAESNVRALEQRMLEYLRDLHVPVRGEDLSVRINRSTYLPEVSGRTFDELSSQGLKTLVNIAHALAHHTVAVDRNLPMPGLLILDGLSANAGHEGFDMERVRDVYRLLNTVADEYHDALQIVAVDNEVPRSILLDTADQVILTLRQNDPLIRIPQSEPA